MKTQTIFFALISLLYLNSLSFGIQADFSIDRQAVLYERENPYIEIPGYHADVDLGDIEVGLKGHVEIELENPSDNDIPFEKLQVGCACVKVLEGEALRNFPAKGKIRLRFSLSVPEKSDSPEVKMVFHFKQARAGETNAEKMSRRDVRVYVTYRLKGMIAFQGKLLSLEVPEGVLVGELKAEFLFTDPLKPKNFSVSVSEGIKGIDFQMKNISDGSGVLIGAVPASLLKDGPIGGEVSICDGLTGRRTSVWVTARVSEPFKLSPLTLTFRKKKGSEDYSATALLGQVLLFEEARTKDGVTPKKEFLETVEVFCALGKDGLTVNKTVLGSGVIRLDLKMTEKQLKDVDRDNQTIRINIRAGVENFEVERDFLVHK